MITLEPAQKDILEKLNEIALEANWGTVERVNDAPKAVAVIQEAMEEIKRLREDKQEIFQALYGYAKQGTHSEDNGYALACYHLKEKAVAGARKYGVKINE